MDERAPPEETASIIVAEPSATGVERTDRRHLARAYRLRVPTKRAEVEGRFRELGPGLITGAADDDPSGIAAYSQAGAAFGFGLLWTALVSLPLMIAVQLMCARIGIVAGTGLGSVLRAHYPRKLLWFACVLLLVGNTINIAADLGGMSAAASSLTGIPSIWFLPAFTAAILVLLVFASYAEMTRVLKWLTLALFAYVFAAFLAHPAWMEVLRGTFAPHFKWTGDSLQMFVAILGTTISPYLFFWQASQNAEQEAHRTSETTDRPRRAIERELRTARTDVNAGMFLSNTIMYFIILTAGATLHHAGLTNIQTAQEAAAALRPLAGRGAALLFTLGLVGTGMLGVPVLAGSGAYAVGEAFAWRTGMDEHVATARNFYGVMAAAMVVGMALDFAHVNAIKLLVWSAMVNGLLAPPLIVIVLVVCNNKRVMGIHTNGPWLNLLGGAAVLLMSGAAVALIGSWFF